MSELDEEWARRLAEAEARARVSGRGDVADYLRLRAGNDAARSAGIDWLLTTCTNLAGVLNRHGSAGVRVERREEHRFRIGLSTMVGTLLTFRAGVRAVSVQAGWPRVPQDGIVRGGGLALAQINHFGNARANQEFLLVRPHPANAPQWQAAGQTPGAPPLYLREEHLIQHLSRLLN
ncbi:MAG TPA: hypothetical protein VM870_02960 [Pyrinomonadaceae bacterium]|nr:hypothetical protein [Pyrinomonadaceae bacterium]